MLVVIKQAEACKTLGMIITRKNLNIMSGAMVAILYLKFEMSSSDCSQDVH